MFLASVLKKDDLERRVGLLEGIVESLQDDFLLLKRQVRTNGMVMERLLLFFSFFFS